MLDMVYAMQVKFKETGTQSTFKYLAGAPGICRCSEAKPRSLGACGPGPSRPEQVLSSAAYRPLKSRRQQEKLVTELPVCSSWLTLKG